MSGYPAARLKVMAMHWLRRKYPDALIVPELAIGKYGDASVDVAAIVKPTDHPLSTSEIVGVEVKGDGDSPARLERQGWVYARVCTRMWLLAAPSIRDRCWKNRPREWAWLDIGEPGVCAPKHSWAPSPWLPTSPLAMSSLLWKTEIVSVAKQLGVPANKSMAQHEVAEAIAEHAPMRKIRDALVETLFERPWAKHPWPKTVYYPSDALPAWEAEEAA